MPEELTGLDYQEHVVMEQIHALQRAHEAQMAPLIKRLVNIRSLRPNPTMFISLEQLHALQELRGMGLIAAPACELPQTEPPVA